MKNAIILLLPPHISKPTTLSPPLPHPLSFDFCEPGETIEGKTKGHEGAKVSENIGQVLLGERIRKAPHKVDLWRAPL